MVEANCINCQEGLVTGAVFCQNCGHQVRCKACQELIVPGAKHCIGCGVAVGKTYDSEVTRSFNTIKFKEDKEGRSYEIEFTNDVGKEIKDVLADILKNKIYLPAEPVALPVEIRNNPLLKSPVVENDPLPEKEKLTAYTAKEESNPYPHLNDLELNLECRENEWILLFAFYLSDFGTTTFSKDKVWTLYKDKRKTETRFKNLGTNWKSLFKKYISTVKENEFRITPQGLDKVKNLLNPSNDDRSGTSDKKYGSINWEKGTGPRNSPVSRKIVANTIHQEPFDIYQANNKESLESFFTRKRPGSGNPNRIITIAYYITKINQQPYFTEGNIDFAYRILNLGGKPVHLKQVIINLKNDRVWFQRVTEGGKSGWRLTRQAEIYVEEKLPQFN
ncbi:zinc ribbon domain-containing protein [Adhaeribacter aquaticus]|uniref:zinc ribbon domain-containing protein n=1 Tax=Adhaeribacter aquaticus TaxID=299567 RepID=UPI000401983F|nr:zinc ribbon domain-containing protein [Adhaeribacter aquaticus]